MFQVQWRHPLPDGSFSGWVLLFQFPSKAEAETAAQQGKQGNPECEFQVIAE